MSKNNEKGKRRNEFYSTKLRAGRRIYYFNVKMNKNGDKYLVIKESRKERSGEIVKTRVMVYEEDIHGFWNKFNDAFEVMTSKDAVKDRRKDQ